jgi:hypothetical protein
VCVCFPAPSPEQEPESLALNNHVNHSMTGHLLTKEALLNYKKEFVKYEITK